MRHRAPARLAVIATLVALAAFAQAADRPAGWGEASHGNDAPLDFATVFPADGVNELRITIAPEAWEAMQADMVALAGEPGSRDGGFPAGDGRPRPPAGARPEGAPPVGWRPVPEVAPSGVRGVGGDGPGGRGTSLIAENPMWVEATIEMDGVVWTHVGVRYKGNSTLLGAWNAGSLKLPFKFDFDEFEDEHPAIKNQRFYGFKQLSLSNAVADASFLRDATAYDLLSAAGLVAPAHAFYHLTLDYGEGPVDLGLYVVMEVVDDTVIPQAFGGDDGNIYEGDGAAASLAEGTRDGIPGAFQKENNDDDPSWADVEAVYDALHAATRTTDPTAWRAGLEAVFDVDAFLRWLALEGMMENWDTYGAMPHNYYLYGDPAHGGRLTWIAWDHDRAFTGGDAPGGPGGGVPGGGVPGGGVPGGGVPGGGAPGGGAPAGGVPGGGPADAPGAAARPGGAPRSATLDRADVDAGWPLIRFLLDDPVYAAAHAAQVTDLAADVFDADAILARTDAYVALIRPYAEAETGAAAFDAAVAALRARVLAADAAADAFVSARGD